MSQHTPGPWTNDSMEFSNGWRCIVNLSDGRSVDVADPRNYTTTEVDVANARLIAAAPELLAALTESLRWIAKVAADHDDEPHLSGRAIRMHDKARAAIRKAQEG